MKYKTVILTLVILAGSFSVSAQTEDGTLEKITSFLAGTWKIEGKETYEKWEKAGGGVFKGKSYRLKGGKEHVSETIEIKTVDGIVYYIPTVFDQNEGLAVRFALTGSNNDEFHFENPDHDFPKKIVYKKVSATEMLVEVSGENGKGFSLKLIKLHDTADPPTDVPK